MKLFSCQVCTQILFFESVTCTRCGHSLGFAPDRGRVCALEPTVTSGIPGPGGSVSDGRPAPPSPPLEGPPPSSPAGVPSELARWRIVGDDSLAEYRLCRNQLDHGVCNWIVPVGEDNEFCRSCRLNHIIPNLATIEAKQAWSRLEAAKRRVLYTLFELGLLVESKAEKGDGGLEFEFLQDSNAPGEPHIYTGHSEGIITINIAEADDPFREKMRVQMGEAYRTVLGHFRHEIGHYYWDRLIKDSTLLTQFRSLFGDERADYAAAQHQHYSSGPPAEWPLRFVSAYASMHPWEDWAEAWAHYLHIVDTLETARAFSLSLRPAKDEVSTKAPVGDLTLAARRLDLHSFDDLIAGWIPLTVALNALNRSMGLSDGYPFVLSEVAIQKMRFVHDSIEQHAHGAAPNAAQIR